MECHEALVYQTVSSLSLAFLLRDILPFAVSALSFLPEEPEMFLSQVWSLYNRTRSSKFHFGYPITITQTVGESVGNQEDTESGDIVT